MRDFPSRKVRKNFARIYNYIKSAVLEYFEPTKKIIYKNPKTSIITFIFSISFLLLFFSEIHYHSKRNACINTAYEYQQLFDSSLIKANAVELDDECFIKVKSYYDDTIKFLPKKDAKGIITARKKMIKKRNL